MTANNEQLQKRITDLIQTQVPTFISEEHPNFVTFMEAYYEWMETKFDRELISAADGISLHFTTDSVTLENVIILDSLTTAQAVSIYSYLSTGSYLTSNARYKENQGPFSVVRKEVEYLSGNITAVTDNGPYSLLVQSIAHDLGFLGTSTDILISGTTYYDGKYIATIVDDNHFIIRAEYIAALLAPAVWEKNYVKIVTDQTLSEELLSPNKIAISGYYFYSPTQTRAHAPSHGLNNSDEITIVNAPAYDGTYIITKLDGDNLAITKTYTVNDLGSFCVKASNKRTIQSFEHLAGQATGATAVHSINHLLSTGDIITIVDSSYFNGTYQITLIDKDYFEISKAWLYTGEFNVSSWLDPNTVGPSLTKQTDWLGTIFASKKLPSYSDVDETIDEFFHFFMKEFMVNIPVSILCDKVKLIKNIKQFYQARGTERSWKLLFRILFNEGVSFYYPEQDILRTDDGRWYQDKSIIVSPYVNTDGSPFDITSYFLHQRIVGYVSKASGVVREIRPQWNGVEYVYELLFEKNTLTGSFQPWESVSLSSSSSYNKAKILPVLQEIIITNPGTGYQWTDSTVTVSSVTYPDTKMEAIITGLGPIGEVMSVAITNHTLGYPVYPAIGPDLPTVTFVSKSTPYITAEGYAVIGALVNYNGAYIGQYGFLDDVKKLRDDYYYQEFSYVAKTTGLSMNYFKTVCKKLVHPAGLKMFCKVLVENNFETQKAKPGSVSTNYNIKSATFLGPDSGRMFTGTFTTGGNTFSIEKDLWLVNSLVGEVAKSYQQLTTDVITTANNLVISNINDTVIVSALTPLSVDCDTISIPQQIGVYEASGTRISATEFKTDINLWPAWTPHQSLVGSTIYSFKSPVEPSYTNTVIISNTKNTITVTGIIEPLADTIEIGNVKIHGSRLSDTEFYVNEILWPVNYLVGKKLYAKVYNSANPAVEQYVTILSNTDSSITFNEPITIAAADTIRLLETKTIEKNIKTVIETSVLNTTNKLKQIDLIMAADVNPLGTGFYLVDEIVYQGSDLAHSSFSATIKSYDRYTNEITLKNLIGQPDTINDLVGASSTARHKISNFVYSLIKQPFLNTSVPEHRRYITDVIVRSTNKIYETQVFIGASETDSIKYLLAAFPDNNISQSTTEEPADMVYPGSLDGPKIARLTNVFLTGIIGHSLYSYNTNKNNGVYSRITAIAYSGADTLLTVADNLFPGASKMVIHDIPKHVHYKDQMNIVTKAGSVNVLDPSHSFIYTGDNIPNYLVGKRLISYNNSDLNNRYESLITEQSSQEITVDSPLHPTANVIEVILADINNYWLHNANYQIDQFSSRAMNSFNEQRRSIICPEPRIYQTNV